MNTNISPLIIFKSGHHVDMNGRTIDFSKEDLQATALAYNTSIHEAPLVVGHPEHNHPAYGWVSSISTDGNVLRAVPSQMDPAFIDLIQNGRFKKISASFYSPDSPLNPKPGVYYLRHVGFLGAQPPAIKGMPDPSFSEKDQEGIVTIQFCEPLGATMPFNQKEGQINKDLWNNFREWLVEKFDPETAEKVIPSSSIDALAVTFAESEISSGSPAIGDREREDIEKGLEDLKAKEIAFAEKQAEGERTLKIKLSAIRRKELEAQVDPLIKDGKILPTEKECLVSFLEKQEEHDVIVFGESQQTIPTKDFLLSLLEKISPRVDFSERVLPVKPDVSHRNSPSPPGYHAESGRIALHSRAMEISKAKSISYQDALKLAIKEDSK